MTVSFFDGKTDNRPKMKRLTWPELVRRLTTHAARDEKDGPLWSPASYDVRPDTRRKSEQVRAICAAVFDYDHGPPPRNHLAARGYAHVLHTTHSHSQDDPRWRVVVPLARPVPLDRKDADWRRLWLRLRAYLAPDATVDEDCKDASRMYYLPACRPGTNPTAEIVPGPFLDLADVPPLSPEQEAAVARPAPPVGERIVHPHRHEVIKSLAGSMRRRGMSEDEMAAALLVVNTRRCDPPIPEEDILRIARNYAEYPPGDPVGSTGERGQGEPPDDGAPHPADAPPPDEPDLLSMSTPPSVINIDNKPRAGSPPVTKADRLAAATGTVTTLRQEYTADVEYLAEPYVALSEVTFVVGAPESMKSWLMADLGRAVHTGGLWMGSLPVAQGKVLYYEQERAKNLVYQTALLETGWQQDLSGIATVKPCGIDLCHPEWQEAIIAQVEREHPALVVFNSYRAVFRGRPPDSSDVAGALGWLGALAERLRCAIMIVDATNKGGFSGRLRGAEAHGDSGQKMYEADTILHLERQRDALGRGAGPVRAYLGKLRYGGKETPPPFVFDVIGDGPDGAWQGGVRLLWLDEADLDPEAAPRTKTGPERLYDALEHPATRSLKELMAATGLTYGSVRTGMTQLAARGLAEAPERGQWRRRLLSTPPHPRGLDIDNNPAAPSHPIPTPKGLGFGMDGSPGTNGHSPEARAVVATAIKPAPTAPTKKDDGADLCPHCGQPATRRWSDGTPLCLDEYRRLIGVADKRKRREGAV